MSESRFDISSSSNKHFLMITAVSSMVWSILLGLWSFMWLTWMLKGEVRSWLAASLFPKSWLLGKSRAEIARMSASEFAMWLVVSSGAPMFVCQLLTCPKCLSAYTAGVGAVLVAFAPDIKYAIVPIIWASAAAIGNFIYDNTK